jgi:glycosyltransferase involved in cell wall biosynthesis
MHRLSVAIITFNEEANIAACIESVRGIADEILVVDSFSSDKTVSIAQEKGARVIPNKFEGHIEQKNYALQNCSYEFVLSLDADERLDETALQEVKIQKEKRFPHEGYILKRLTFIGKKAVKHGSWYPDKKLRLVKKDNAEWTGINPHDRLEVRSTNIFTLQGNILHFSYKTTEELFEKTKRYSEISAKHLYSLQRKNTFSPRLKGIFRFIKHYFLKMGFLAGKLGWQIGKQQYYEALWKYRTLSTLNQEAKGKK